MEDFLCWWISFSEGIVYSVHIITQPTYCCIQQLRYLSDCPHAALNVERSSTHVRDRHFSCVIFQVTDRYFSCVILKVKKISHAWFFQVTNRHFPCVIFQVTDRNYSCAIFQVTDRHFSCVTLVEFTHLEDGTDRLSRKVGKELSPYTA